MNPHFKKFFKTIFITILILSLVILQIPFSALAFGNKSHEQLSELAFTQVLTDLELTQHLRALPILVRHSTGPDRDEKQGLGWYYEAHFFNIDEDLFKSDTALTRMEHHYEYAVKYARGGDWRRAIEELARALHYLQDMCCPVHMWGYEYNNIPLNLRLHVFLESVWDAMWDSENVLRYVLTDKRVEENFKSSEDLGKFFAREALNCWQTWIKKKNIGTTGKIIDWINTINPLAWTITEVTNLFKWLLNDSSKIGFYDGWENIFLIPYTASYELVKMWVETVNDFTPPNKICPVQ